MTDIPIRAQGLASVGPQDFRSPSADKAANLDAGSTAPSAEGGPDASPVLGEGNSHRSPLLGDGFSRQIPAESTPVVPRLTVSTATATAPAEPPPPPVSARQFADSYGRVNHLALMLSSYVGGTARKQVLNAYKTLFERMEPDTRFSIVVASERDRADVQKVIKDAGIANPDRIKFIQPDTDDLTVWARDMMVTADTPDQPDHTGLLEQTPLHNWHGSDVEVPGFLVGANPTIIPIPHPDIVTDGGDVMSNTKQAFVGYYSIAATAEKLQRISLDPAVKTKLFADYEARTGNRVVESRSEHPFPFAFEPVQVSPGEHRFPFKLVHDPAYRAPKLASGQVSEAQAYEDMAAGLFEKALGKPVVVMGKDDPNTPEVEEPATDHMDMGLTPVDDKTFFLGDPGLAGRLLEALSPAERSALQERLSDEAGHPVSLQKALDRNRDNPKDFDAYERTLKEQGYNVIRVPHAEPGTFNAYVSYNNCLMERFEKDGKEVRRVFLPSYGIDKLDNYAADAYRSQGFEVIPIPLDALSQRWGALRCISNWLERSPRG